MGDEALTEDRTTPTLHDDSDADLRAISLAMLELLHATVPLFELASPPSWAVTMRSAIDVASRDIEKQLQKDKSKTADFALPLYQECIHKMVEGEPLTALEKFIHDYEPIAEAEDWRDDLSSVLKEVAT